MYGRAKQTDCQTAFNTKQVLLPPKPKAFDTATRTGCGRASLATWHKAHSGSGSSRLIVGGTARLWMAIRQTSASSADAAVNRWPVMLLVELTGRVAAPSPNTRCKTRASALSPTGVLVAWALT